MGIVDASDAKSDPDVRVLATFPEDSHPHAPMVYPAAKVARGTSPDAQAFLAYLRSPEARRRFEESGFAMIGAPIVPED